MRRCQVLVIGAGPTGLMAANQLRRFGVDVIIADKKSGPTIESRAIFVSARSLEIYQQMGLSEQVLREGTKVKKFSLYSGGRKKTGVQLEKFGEGKTDFNFVIAYEQSKNEKLLYENLKRLNGEVLWETEFVEFKDLDGPVRAIFENGHEKLEIECDFVIGCDGASSLVRHLLDFSFRGGTYENKFFVADTRMDWNLDYGQVVISPGKHNLCAFVPLYGDRNYRVIGTLPRAYANRDDIGFQDIEWAIKNTFRRPLTFEEVNWFSVYKLHHRGVSHFREGPVFLAGDSAHIHSPAGGQGMNTGLQDAYNLAWKLAYVFKGYWDKSLLDSYNQERLPFARWLLKFTDRGFVLMSSQHAFVSWLRQNVLIHFAGIFGGIGVITQMGFDVISQTWYNYRKSSITRRSKVPGLRFRSGDRLPYVEEGFYRKFSAPSFYVLHIGEEPLEEERRSQIASNYPFPIHFIESDISLWKKWKVRREVLVLIRPDQYIMGITDNKQQ